MAKPLNHLLLVTLEDAFDLKSWSGIPWSLRTALERHVDRVTVFRPARPRRTPWASLKRLLFGARRFPLWITRATLRRNARQVRTEIARTRPDAVLSISSQCVAFLQPPGVPVFLFSDAPYLAFCEAYAPWDTPPGRIQGFAREEAAAARRLDGLCFGSAWACGEAARLYTLAPPAASARLHVTPLGANWVPPVDRDEILRRIQARPADRIDLLFVGRDWERKGGPLAVEVTRLLRQAGHAVTLHIVGCRPPLESADTAPGGLVAVHGPLYRTDPGQSARLAELFLGSHFLLVPTLAECFGIVFAEAHAFGLPPVSRAVHALPSIVQDGVTGLLFPPEAPASSYAESILRLAADPEAYRSMARRARLRFEQTLNWDRTAREIVDAISQNL